MIQRINLLERFRRAAAAYHFSPMRRLVLTGAALGTAGFGWFWSRGANDYTAESVIHAVCDRLLPAWGAHPGAIATEVHLLVLEDLRAMSDTGHLQALVTALHDVRFLDLSVDQQDGALQDMLRARYEPGISRTLQYVLNQSVKYYFSHPDSWHALDYRQPQPLGYPDYATCAT